MRVSQFFIPSVVLAVASFALVRCSFGPSAYSGELPGPPPDAGSGGESGGGEGGDAVAAGDSGSGSDATAETGSDATTGNDVATEGGDATAVDAAASAADGGTGG